MLHTRRKSNAILILICVMLVLAWAVYYLASSSPAPVSASPLAVDIAYRAHGPLSLHYTFAHGVQTYSGAVPVYTDCETVSGSSALEGKTATVMLSVYTSGSSCGALPAGSTQPFVISVPSDSSAAAVGTLDINGTPAAFTLTRG